MATGLVERVQRRLQHRVQGFLKRMVGFNAGLPQGVLDDRTVVGAGAIPLRGEAPSDYQRSGTTVRVRGFERHPVVMACVRAIVDIASAVELQAYKLVPGEEREVVEVLPSSAPIQQIMDVPSPFLSPMRLREITATHYLIYGNAFWFLERPPSANPAALPQQPYAIRIIHPEDVMTVYVNTRGYPIWYSWSDTLGYMHTSPVTDIVHFRDLNAKGLVFGYPRAASALNDIIGDDEASQFVRQTVTNSGAPLSWALVHEDTTLAEAQAAEAAYYEKMVVRGNRGRFTFLGGVKDIKSTSFNLRDLEFPDLRRVSREDICAAFGVDPRIVGIASASSDAGLSGVQYTEARIRLVQQTVEPMLRYFESELNFWFAPEYGDVYLRYDPDELKALIENDDLTSTRVRGEVAAGLRTIEEAREALDLPSDFELDDTLAISGGVQFIPTAVALDYQPPPQPGMVPPGGPPLGPDGLPLPPGDGGGGAEVLPGGAGVGGVDAAAQAAGTAAETPPPPGAAPIGDAPEATSEPDTNEEEFQIGADDQAEEEAGGKPPLTPKRSDAPKKGLAQGVTRPYPSSGAVLTRGVILTPEQRSDLWRQFDERAVREEAAYRRAALMQFAEERANIARLFERAQTRNAPVETTLDGVARQLRQMYKPGGEVVQRWADRYHALIGETFAKGGAHIAHSINRSSNRSSTRFNPNHDDLGQFAEEPGGGGGGGSKDGGGDGGDGGGGDTATATEEPPKETAPKGPTSSKLDEPSSAYPPANADARHTDVRYRQADGSYTPERTALHDEIVAQRFVGKTPVENPRVTVMGGGPASGKSVMIEQEGLGGGNAVTADADSVKAQLPEFREGVAKGQSNVASYTHEESSHVGKRIVKDGIDGGYNVVVDGTGDNSYENLKKKVAGYRAQGHPVDGNYVTVDTDVAVARAKARGDRTGRQVPEPYLRETHASVSRVVEQAIRDGLYDNLTVWDTNTKGKAVKIASAKGKQLTVHDPVAWERFLLKGRVQGPGF